MLNVHSIRNIENYCLRRGQASMGIHRNESMMELKDMFKALSSLT